MSGKMLIFFWCEVLIINYQKADLNDIKPLTKSTLINNHREFGSSMVDVSPYTGISRQYNESPINSIPTVVNMVISLLRMYMYLRNKSTFNKFHTTNILKNGYRQGRYHWYNNQNPFEALEFPYLNHWYRYCVTHASLTKHPLLKYSTKSATVWHSNIL